MAETRAPWTLADLVDFEVLLAEDERELADDRDAARVRVRIRERDRAIYRGIEDGAGVSATAARGLPWERRWLFHRWLETRRQQAGIEPGTSAGASFTSALSLLAFVVGVAGLALGKAALLLGLSGGRLAGGPEQPVNVLFFLLTCVVPPFLLSLTTAVLLLVRRGWGWPGPPPVWRSLFAAGVQPLLRWLLTRLQHAVPVERRLDLGAAVGLLRTRAEAHGAALGWPLLGLMQWFALGYATAVAVGALLSVQIWHQTFAWQTTVGAYTPERVHVLVRAVAVPWSWFLGEGDGYPTRASVAATQFHRHRNPADLPAGAAGSWWVFVVLTAVVYAWVPRWLLLLGCRGGQRSALARESFAALRYDPLYERLVTAAVAWRNPEASGAMPDAADPSLAAGAAGRDASEGARGPCVLVVPDELDSPALREGVAGALREQKGWVVRACLTLEVSAAGRRTLLTRLGEGPEEREPARIVLVQEAFMPPTREVLEFLGALRAAPRFAGGVLVGLMGKPGVDPLGEPARAADVGVWRKRVQSLGDPNLEVQPLRPN